MRIRVADQKLGECVITTNQDIDKCEEFTIKSLCMLQILCMNKKEFKEKSTEFIQILNKAIDNLNELYAENSFNYTTDTDPTDQF